MLRSFSPAGFARQGVLNKDPTVWLNGVTPLTIKSNYGFNKLIIQLTQSTCFKRQNT
jgi:hypothetical protein